MLKVLSEAAAECLPPLLLVVYIVFWVFRFLHKSDRDM